MSRMKKNLFIFWLGLYGSLYALVISDQDAKIIGDRIYKNECGGKNLELTHWKEKENFASLGTCHFIWYHKEKKEGFEETFPALLLFLRNQGVNIYPWLLSQDGCPWKSREEFYSAIDSKQMNELRDLLFKTVDLQAKFVANRLENLLPKILTEVDQNDKEDVSKLFYTLAKEPNGLYALIDYLNFKGSGLVEKERYNGKGWGLLQVLTTTLKDSNNPLNEFVKAAKFTLSKRVQHSPKERDENRYLRGWNNRLDSYLVN